MGYVLRAEGRQGKVTFYFREHAGSHGRESNGGSGGQKIENLKELKELEKMDGIDSATYQDALEKFKSEKHKHSAGLRVYGGMPVQTREGIVN